MHLTCPDDTLQLRNASIQFCNAAANEVYAILVLKPNGLARGKL